MSVRKVCQGYGAKGLAWPGNSQRTNDEANTHTISGSGSRGWEDPKPSTHTAALLLDRRVRTVAHSGEFPSVTLSFFQFTGSLFSHSDVCKC